MKKSFTTGLIILLPFALTVWVVVYLFDLFTNPLFNLMESLLLWFEKHQNPHLFHPIHHRSFIIFLSRIGALILTFAFIVILGFLGRRFFAKNYLKGASSWIFRIPIIGTIYRLTKDLTKAVLSGDKKTFKETVLIPFPSAETYTIGFVTGEIPFEIKRILPQADMTVFVPTAPHPISGYILFASKTQIHSLPISIEDTFRFLLSCGVVFPETNPPSHAS